MTEKHFLWIILKRECRKVNFRNLYATLNPKSLAHSLLLCCCCCGLYILEVDLVFQFGGLSSGIFMCKLPMLSMLHLFTSLFQILPLNMNAPNLLEPFTICVIPKYIWTVWHAEGLFIESWSGRADYSAKILTEGAESWWVDTLLFNSLLWIYIYYSRNSRKSR